MLCDQPCYRITNTISEGSSPERSGWTYNTNSLISYKIGWMDLNLKRELHVMRYRNCITYLIVAFHKVVELQGPCLDRKHQATSQLLVDVSNSTAPHFQGIAGESIFWWRLLIFTICWVKKSLRPRVAVIPVKASREREIGILRARICIVTD